MKHWTKYLPEVGDWADSTDFEASLTEKRIADLEEQIKMAYAYRQEIEDKAMAKALKDWTKDEISQAIIDASEATQ